MLSSLYIIFACATIAALMLIMNGKSLDSTLLPSFSQMVVNSTSSTSTKSSATSTCVLPKYDPWSSDVMRYVNIRNGDNAKCSPKTELLTKLEHGKIVAQTDKYDCVGRCITRKDDYKNVEGEWQEPDYKFDCDIVESRCMKPNTTTPVYGMLHTQVVPVKVKETTKQLNETSNHHKKYSVFVLLIDSMGASQAERNIPKAMHYLEKSMKAITFPYVNKVGLNSRPNGIALWFGKQVETIKRTIYGLPTIHPDITYKEYCSNYMDKFTSIFEEYRNEGYKTLLGDDWARGVLNWPNCYGFEQQPVDHILQPFLISVETKGTPVYKTYSKANCKFVHLDGLNYLQQFIDAYKGNPMFAWFWTSLVSHDDENSSMRLDTDILDFLVKNRKEFDNSFVLVMGDHGLRFGGVTNTRLGALDVNNPLLTISLPKELRDSEIYRMMETNSHSLQTHFDTRATLLDILKYQPETNFTDTESMPFENEKGQSFMRDQIGERSCRTLPIPFDYCICELAKEKQNRTSPESIGIGRAIIESINEHIENDNATDQCPQWKFSKVISISAYLPREEMNAYSVIAGVSAPYAKAQFRAIVHKSPTGALTVGSVDRVDSYGERGHCVNGNLAPICDCKTKKS